MSEVAATVPWPFEPPPVAPTTEGFPAKGDLHEVTFLSSTVSEQRDDTLIKVTSSRYPTLSWWTPLSDIDFEQVAARKKTEPEIEYAELDLGERPPQVVLDLSEPSEEDEVSDTEEMA